MIMKKILLLILLVITMLSCSVDDDLRRNPYLPDLNFSARLDLNLPQYNNLKFPGNSFIARNYGLNGFVIYNLNNDQYLAYELSDPNHILQECSILIVEGIEAKCSCDDGNRYNIITGQRIAGEGEYSLKPYRVEKLGNTLQVSN